MQKVLYSGGQKSGKSKLAEVKALELAKENKPYYIATYNNSVRDVEMTLRIDAHKEQRKDSFHTIEELLNLDNIIKDGETYLVDCISMWIFNNLDNEPNNLLEQLEYIANKNANIVFVLNEVGTGIIPSDQMSRKFVDLTGMLGQKLASFCDEVYDVKLGIGIKIK